MSDTRTLRDKCEHDRYEDHSVIGRRCPGGREVTLKRVPNVGRNLDWPFPPWYEIVEVPNDQ